MDEIKKIEKDGSVGKDRAKDLENEVQELTDDHIKRIDEILSQKESEIRQVYSLWKLNHQKIKKRRFLT